MNQPRHKLPARQQAKVLKESPAVRFFFEHAGCSCPAGSTKAQQFAARLEYARTYAAGEARAREIGLVYAWTPDECEPIDEMGNARYVVCVYRDGDAEIEWPSLVNVRRGAAPLACLGSVTGGDDAWNRVLKAELALEAIDALDAEAQEQADELAARATYAAGSVR